MAPVLTSTDVAPLVDRLTREQTSARAARHGEADRTVMRVIRIRRPTRRQRSSRWRERVSCGPDSPTLMSPTVDRMLGGIGKSALGSGTEMVNVPGSTS